MNVTKLELCTRVAKRFYLSGKNLSSVNDYKELFEIFIDEIFNAMAEGYRIEIRGFGNFKPVERKKRIGRNPRSGEIYTIPPYPSTCFKFSKEAQKIFEEKLIAFQEKYKNTKKL